jgi:hypothetical protein
MQLIDRLADRAASAVLRSTVAEAGCSYRWYTCYCSGGLRYSKKCMYGCSGVPDHCYSCNTVTGSC